MIEKYDNTEDLMIPLLNPYELKLMVSPNGESHVFYGVTNKSDCKKAVDIMNKYITGNSLGESCAAFDFRNDTKLKSKRWFTEDELNVYENTKCTEWTSLLSGNKEGYERVYWFIQDKK